MKISKILMALLASTMLFGAVSCSNNDDDNNTVPPTAGTTTVTKGTVSDNAVTEENGTKVATLTSDAGTYKFTENTAISSSFVARTADSSASGTWTFTETGKINPKYSGTYTGDISSITSDTGTTLNLTVTKVASSDGTLVEVKTKQAFEFKASKTEGFTATIPAVEVKTEESTPTTNTTTPTTPTTTSALPASVGDNEVSGKTFRELFFTSDTATMTISEEEKTITETYKYSWNATKKLVYLKLQSVNFKIPSMNIDVTCASAAEEISAYEQHNEATEARKLAHKEETNLRWATLMVFKYEISNGAIVSLDSYFDKTCFPASTEHFTSSKTKINEIQFWGDGILYIGISSDNSWNNYYIYPTYEDGKFTATLFLKISSNSSTGNSTWENKGTVKGTYSIDDGVDKEAKITLTFTEVPESVSVLKDTFELIYSKDDDTSSSSGAPTATTATVTEYQYSNAALNGKIFKRKDEDRWYKFENSKVLRASTYPTDSWTDYTSDFVEDNRFVIFVNDSDYYECQYRLNRTSGSGLYSTFTSEDGSLIITLNSNGNVTFTNSGASSDTVFTNNKGIITVDFNGENLQLFYNGTNLYPAGHALTIVEN